MIQLYDKLAFTCSKWVTNTYSTSFSMAVNLLSPEIREAIHSIYGFVRLADEIVDTFHDWDRKEMLEKFEKDYQDSVKYGISLNPILHSFQKTVVKYKIDHELIDAFLKSMAMDLEKSDYITTADYKEYIYGSADVVGLMCLKVFVSGDQEKYDELKDSAMSLGSAFQKVNFLRDLKNDIELLNRSYFPNVDLNNLDPISKQAIIQEIEEDFSKAYEGIMELPQSARFGVYTAYVYYKRLLKKLKNTASHEIMEARIRVDNHVKVGLLVKSYFDVRWKMA